MARARFQQSLPELWTCTGNTDEDRDATVVSNPTGHSSPLLPNQDSLHLYSPGDIKNMHQLSVLCNIFKPRDRGLGPAAC